MDAHPDACYRSRADIPAHLKPASWFNPASWYRRELRACAAYVGRRRAWPLYHRNEKRRLDRKFRLRLFPVNPPLDPHEMLASRTQLRRRGWRDADIDTLVPASEDYNPVGHVWYPLYRVPRRPEHAAGMEASNP